MEGNVNIRNYVHSIQTDIDYITLTTFNTLVPQKLKDSNLHTIMRTFKLLLALVFQTCW